MKANKCDITENTRFINEHDAKVTYKYDLTLSQKRIR